MPPQQPAKEEEYYYDSRTETYFRPPLHTQTSSQYQPIKTYFGPPEHMQTDQSNNTETYFKNHLVNIQSQVVGSTGSLRTYPNNKAVGMAVYSSRFHEDIPFTEPIQRRTKSLRVPLIWLGIALATFIVGGTLGGGIVAAIVPLHSKSDNNSGTTLTTP